MERPVLDTHQKAHSINMDRRKYGTIAEIGAGQETARWFFRVGGAAGTIAKAISAYDMQISDSIYGECDRYVSRERLEAMLATEFMQVKTNLGQQRAAESTYFAFANTVAAYSYTTKRAGHGWLGIRFQTVPCELPSQLDLHVVLKGNKNVQDQEVLGILGVNLIYAALHLHDNPEVLLRSLMDDLSASMLEIDMVDFQGPAFRGVDNRLMALRLVEYGLSSAAMFRADGRVAQPSDLLYKKAVLVERSRFRPPTRFNMQLLDSACQAFCSDANVDRERLVVLSEMTLHSLGQDGAIDPQDFLFRVDLLCALGKNVLITDYARFYQLAEYLFRHTREPVGVALGVATLRQIFEERHYQDLGGGTLEAFGRMFRNDLRLYACPWHDPETGRVDTVQNLELGAGSRHLYRHLLDNGYIHGLDDLDPQCLAIHSQDVLAQIRSGLPGWETLVPDVVVELIRNRQLFKCAS